MADEDEELDQVEDDEDAEIGDSDEVTDAVADGDADADVEVEDEDEEVAAAPASRTRKLEQVEVHSSAARAALRDTIAADVEAFLKRGGSIEKVEADHRADPPKKPESNYGRGSI
jgi:hypothetical protein